MTEKIKKTLDKLDSFSKLEPGWKYGQGLAIPAERIEQAKKLIDVCAKFKIDSIDVFPGAGSPRTIGPVLKIVSEEIKRI